MLAYVRRMAPAFGLLGAATFINCDAGEPMAEPTLSKKEFRAFKVIETEELSADTT